MAKSVEISAVIITFNEDTNIGRCLESLNEVADEIVVVDSFSTDRTEEICKNKAARFIRHPFEGHVEQKNYAMSQASLDHVLSLDADESLSEELKKSILSPLLLMQKRFFWQIIKLLYDEILYIC